MNLTPGTTIHAGPAASVQFDGDRALNLRIVAVDDASTWEGWAFIDGYVLNTAGRATERRTIYVRVDGLTPATTLGNPAREPHCHPGRPHRGRNLCAPCYGKNWRAGTLDQHPRVTRPHEEVIAAYQQYEDTDLGHKQIARRLGVTTSALTNALHRERQRQEAMAS